MNVNSLCTDVYVRYYLDKLILTLSSEGTKQKRRKTQQPGTNNQPKFKISKILKRVLPPKVSHCYLQVSDICIIASRYIDSCPLYTLQPVPISAIFKLKMAKSSSRSCGLFFPIFAGALLYLHIYLHHKTFTGCMAPILKIFTNFLNF